MRPADTKFMKSHEWARSEGDLVVVGISDFAVKQLTDLTYIQLPEVGDTITKGESFGEIESVKAVSDLYSPVSGEVVEVNTRLSEGNEFELLANEPYGDGWLLKVKPSSAQEMADLLDREAYDKVVAESEED